MALGRNITFPIYNDDGTSFHGLELRRSSVESLVMSLSDKITGDVYYDGGVELEFTMKEYVMYDNVKYTLVSPPTIVREGMTSDNSELKGTTKYSFEFYHPMYWLANYPFSDVAVTSSEGRYKSHDKSFSWIGTIVDYVAKLNKNLEGTEWVVSISSRVPQADLSKLSEVLTFNDNSIADALKTAYDTYKLPYVIDSIKQGETYYSQGKRFLISFGLPPNEIYDSGNIPYVFRFGQGVGLKNNSRNPRKNKIITRIAGYGSENNIPYGYPQIVWTGSQDATQTADGYPLYDGIVGGLVVKLIKHPFTRSHLMPSVYVDRVRRKVNSAANDYNPNIELIDYYDADSSYPNPINPIAPNYEIHAFEDIKPELGQESITGVQPLNDDLTPASGWDDTMDDDGNYLQSYFRITLPILSFDIYACAAITEAMQINMRSGGCIGCTFDVQVDWDDYKRNFYDEQGNFLPNGAQRDLTKYPKSNSSQVSLIVQKDLNTFGTLMPNRYQYPQSGDDFVILGISLPTSYITSAQTRLDSAMQSFMLANNEHYYDYPLKFDEYFLVTRTDLLSQIRNNSILRFAFGSTELELFVKQIVVKYGQGVLPQYDITLTDNIEVVLNKIGQVQEDVDNLTSIISALRQSFSNNVWVELSKKLSKVSDDIARGFITFLQGLQVGQRFTSGLLGEGGVFRKNADGSTYIEADSLYIRMKAYFDTLEVRKLQYSSGNRVASAAGIKAVKVARVGTYNGNTVVLDDEGYYHYTDGQGQEQKVAVTTTAYRCYFRMTDADGNRIDNDFVVGDLARSQEFNMQSGLNSYWRKVVRTNGQTPDEDGLGWIDLSDVSGEYLDGSGTPQAQDDIVQLGNVSDTGRQGAIIEYSVGGDGANAPSYQIYQGINSFSLNNKNYIDLGYNPQTNRAYLNVYGDFFFGNPTKDAQTNEYTGSYIKYNAESGLLEIKGKIEASSTVGSLSFEQYIQQNAWSQSMETNVNNLIHAVTDDLIDQIDGAIETWFYDADPAMNTVPTSNWTTNELKDQHIGDLYYAGTSGKAFRFIKNEQGVYSWTELSNDAIAEALAQAREAQQLAGTKGKIIITGENVLPTPPYQVGDLWVNAYWSNGTITYANDILRCSYSRASGAGVIGDWTLASKYTDDSSLITFLDGYSGTVTDIKNQIDQKAETWYQSTDPSVNWSTNAIKKNHVGDLWMDTRDGYGKKTYIYKNNGTEQNPNYQWVAQDVPTEVFDTIDGKSSIFVNYIAAPPTNYKANDLWILQEDATIGNVSYKSGELLTATNDSETYNPNHWTKLVRYTDDTALNTFVSQITNGTSSTSGSAPTANALYMLKQALAQKTTTEGGLVLSTLIAMRDVNNTTWAGISGAYQTAETGTGYKGHGIAAWYGGGAIDHEVNPSTSGYAKSLFRFDGSGYLASGNISWDKNGIVTITNVYADVNGTATSLSGSLQTLTNLSNALPLSVVSGTTYLAPQYSFKQLSVMGKAVATQEWVSSNYVSISFFETLFNALDSNNVKVNANTTSGIASIKAKKGLWTEQYLSAYGQSAASGGGGGGGGSSTLEGLTDTSVSSASNGQVLVYQNGVWVNGEVTGGATAADITAALANYYTKSDSDSRFLNKSSSQTKNYVFAAPYSANGVPSFRALDPSDIPSLNASKINAGTFDVARIPQNINITGNAATATKLANSVTLWGQSFDGSANVSGDMGSVGSITPSANGKSLGNSTYRFVVYGTTGNYSGAVTITGLLTASGGITVPSSKTIKIGDATLSWDSTKGMLKVDKGFYSDYNISALGSSSTGSASSSVFTSSNTNITNASNGQVLTYNGSTGMWIPTTISAGGGGSGSVTQITVTTPSNTGLLVSNGTSQTISAQGTFAFSFASGYKLVKDTEGSSGTYYKVTTNAYGQVTSGVATLSASDISGLSDAYYPKAGTTALTPATDAQRNLGTSSLRWNNIYGKQGNFDVLKVKVDGTYTNVLTSVPLTVQGTGNAIASLSTGTSGGLIATKGTFLPLSGGTMTGAITLKGDQYYHDENYSLNMNNSDIIGANCIYFADALNGQTEGLFFPRSSGSNYDMLRIYNGEILFAPNIVKGSTGNTQYNILHTNNYSAVLDDRYVTLGTPQEITGIKTFSAVVKLNGFGIEDVGGSGLLIYHPTGSWTGISGSQWGVGSIDSQGVIRSSANHLVHYRNNGGGNYNILDTYNAPHWTMWIYPESGSTGSFATHINSNTDLNSILEAGTYYCYSGTTAATLSNTPYTAGNFRLWNIVNTGTNGAANNSWFAQLLLAPNSGDFYIRGHTSNGFYSWARLFKSTGGSITGHIYLDGAQASSSTGNTSQIIFRVGSTQQVAISSNANALIINPTSSTTTGQWVIGVNGHNTYSTGSGNFGIGVSPSSSYKLHVAGTIYATGDVAAASDIRLKNVVSNVDVPIERIASLPVFDFTWNNKKDDLLHSGTSAQAVQEVLPNAVFGEDELGLNYGVAGTIFGVLNARAIMKNRMAIINNKGEIEILKERIAMLEDRIRYLEGRA